MYNCELGFFVTYLNSIGHFSVSNAVFLHQEPCFTLVCPISNFVLGNELNTKPAINCKCKLNIWIELGSNLESAPFLQLLIIMWFIQFLLLP